MVDDTEPMQADGEGTRPKDRRDPLTAGRPDMQDNNGQSGGGSYPNPYDQKGGNPQEDESFHGGQSIMGYQGKGSEDPEEDTGNATAKED